MKKQTKISNAVIKRLPRYRRYLNELRRKGVDKISSNEFSRLIGYTASQIRQGPEQFRWIRTAGIRLQRRRTVS